MMLRHVLIHQMTAQLYSGTVSTCRKTVLLVYGKMTLRSCILCWWFC